MQISFWFSFPFHQGGGGKRGEVEQEVCGASFSAKLKTTTHHIFTKVFSQQKGETWRVLVALNTCCSKGVFSDCFEQICVPPLLRDLWVTAPRVCLSDPSKQVEDTPQRAPGGSPEQTDLEKNITAVEKDIMILSYSVLVSKTPVKLEGEWRKKSGCVTEVTAESLSPAMSLLYQTLESKCLIKNSWHLRCLLIQFSALGFTQILASFLLS